MRDDLERLQTQVVRIKAGEMKPLKKSSIVKLSRGLKVKWTAHGQTVFGTVDHAYTKAAKVISDAGILYQLPNSMLIPA